MHWETYYYYAKLSDGTKVRFERTRQVSDYSGEHPGSWMPTTTHKELMEAYEEFKSLTE